MVKKAEPSAQPLSELPPDMESLRAAGVSLEDAVRQCEEWKKAHEAPAEPPQPEPVLNLDAFKPSAPATKPPVPAAIDPWTAMSRLHTFCEQLESGHAACVTSLVDEGWSLATAREIASTVNAARPVNVKADGMPGFQRKMK